MPVQKAITIEDLQERKEAAFNTPAHNPTAKPDGIVLIDKSQLTTDESDYPWSLEFWTDDTITDEERTDRMTAFRCKNRAKKIYDTGGMPSIEMMVDEAKRKRNRKEQFKQDGGVEEWQKEAERDLRNEK